MDGPARRGEPVPAGEPASAIPTTPLSIAEPGPGTPVPSFLLSPPLERSPSSRRSGSRESGPLLRRARRNTAIPWMPQLPKHLKSPLLMVVFFLVGFGLSLGHCIFYPQLSSRIVGDSNQQEERLRIGTALSFLAQMAFTAAVWKAYTQWLWRAVDRHKSEWTASGLNAAFSADTSPFAFLHLGLLENFTLGAIMAFTAWALIVPPFFTPAALYVYKSTNEITAPGEVPILAIANETVGGHFAYSPPQNSGTIKSKDDKTRILSGPRTVVALLASATASRGEILPIEPPSNHSAYSIGFFGPIIRCDNANDTVATQIQGLLQEHMGVMRGSAEQIDSAYYGFVPSFGDDGELVPLSQTKFRQLGIMANELWMTFQRYVINESGERVRTRISQVCRLHNATYELTIKWDRGVQLINHTYDILEQVGYPDDQPGQVSNMAKHAYSAFMWALTDQLVGSLGWFREISNRSGSRRLAQFGSMDSPLRHTSLLGSSDLDVYFDFNWIHNLYVQDNETGMSAQRRQDKALAKNRTLSELIEDLSFNLTVSLMHNKLLTSSATRDVTRWIDVNRYGYVATSLFIPYGLANFAAFFALVAGLYSFIAHGTNPDKKFQDIANAATEKPISDILSDYKEDIKLRSSSSFSPPGAFVPDSPPFCNSV
ncbi:unnamed protein product [Clonostachys solani]|uniref:Uncharacterized protein n=1 Tax=Clonostachys solani TaxID=160281 RepID=A0A9N9ZDU2_9HYPO|nr:unnamed protein product [Clonostachys solani]